MIERFGGPSRTSATMHQSGVDHDPVEPCAELRATAESRNVAIDLQEGILDDVRRIGFTRQATCETKHAMLISQDERLEGGIVARGGSCREGLVVRFLGAGDHCLDSRSRIPLLP